MRSRRLLIIAALAASLAACKGKSSSTTTPPPATEVATAEPTPAPAEETPPAEPALAPGERPAVVTDEMVALAEKMIVAMEAMGTDLTAAGTDCTKGAAVLRTHAKKLQPIVAEAKKFIDIKDPAADKWFQDTYSPRLMAVMGGFMQLAQSCASDKDFTLASEEFSNALAM